MPIKAGNTTKINEDIKDIKSAIDGNLNTTGDILLAHNTTYRRGELASLTLPTITPADNHISMIEFTSGATPTTVTDNSGAKWVGDGVALDNGAYVFAPVANTRYNVSLAWDGVNLIAVSLGIAI